MTATVESVLAGPWGAVIAILAMALATYACRVSGVAVMSRIRPSPRLERALRALPGSIVVAVTVPVAVAAGPAGVVGVLAAGLTMALTRLEGLAIVVGVVVVAGGRALGW